MNVARSTVAAASVALMLASATGVASADPAESGVDLLSIGLDGDTLVLTVSDASDIAHDVAALRFAAPASPIPDVSGIVDPGEETWTVGTSDVTRPPHLDASSIDVGALVNDAITLSVSEMTGPGDLAVYTVDDDGAQLVLGTGRGAPASATITAGSEPRGTLWAFDEPGAYAVTIAATARSSSGIDVSAEATYTIETGDATADTVPGLLATLVGPPGDSAPSEVDARADAERVVIADGHVDMGPRFVDGTWIVQVRDDTGAEPTWRNLADVVLHVKDNALIEVPAGEEFAFLGAAGDPVWLLPQSQQSGIVWPGWNTQDPSVVGGVSGATTWRLDSVDGPGNFALFTSGSFGEPNVLFDSGKSLPQELSISNNTHAHGNWAFTKAGVYRLTVTFTAAAKDGGTVNDTRVLAVAVGDDTDPGDGFADGPGDGGGPGDGPDGLPITGSAWFVPLAVTGVALIVAGIVVLVVVRRRALRSPEAS